MLSATALMMATALSTTSCKDDTVLTGQPEWLGNSIYERLEDEGTYSTVLRLIDDLGQKEVLAHTGSKTLFVADDQAYDEWFRTNSWGVRNYDALSTAQKKLLLNNSMINNAYLIELMSNVKAKSDNATPIEGEAMRRETAVTIYDSVYIMPVAQFPNTAAWDALRQKGKPIPIMRDFTAAPMIHFLPTFMYNNSITNDDLSFLTNGVATSTAEAWVNGMRVTERDITCKNGYIQKVDGVIESSPNMAQIIHNHENMSMWAHLMDRFSAPYLLDDERTSNYNRLYNREDTVYVLRYFSDRCAKWTKTVNNATTTKTVLDEDPDGNPVENRLKFDPGWNQYIDAQEEADDTYDLHYDAAVMLVPTNTALEKWWNNEGHDLKDEYKEWDNVTDDILASLIRVNQLPNLTSAVPSKFGTVLNDAREELGITAADVDSCFMGCNGIVYLTNKVFAPAEFASVYYPALAHGTTMSIIYWAITGAKGISGFPFNFKPYLLSMDSWYGMMLPTNDAMKFFVDPFSYGGTADVVSEEGDTTTVKNINLVEFEYDVTKSPNQYVQGKSYKANVNDDGSFTKTEPDRVTTLSTDIVRNMLERLIDQLIIVIPDPAKAKTIDQYVDEGYNYFLTKGGSTVRVTRGNGGNLQFEGGWQMEGNGPAVQVTERFTKENGVSYKMEDGLPLPATNSLWTVTQNHPEYDTFMELAKHDMANLFITTMKASAKETFTCGNSKRSKNLRLFDNYNYTVYIPTSSSVQQLIDEQKLPTLEELDAFAGDDDTIDSLMRTEGWYPQNIKSATELKTYRANLKKLVQNIVVDFIRYHVQDHSVAIGMAAESNNVTYESMKRNPETKRFYTLDVQFDTNSLTVTDGMGQKHSVVKTDGLYNNVCREYWFLGGEMKMASDVIVHLIDSPLMYTTMRPWRDVVKEGLGL